MKYVVIHSLGGKSPLVKSGVRFETDAAKDRGDPRVEDLLRTLRRRPDNQIWHCVLRQWVTTLPPQALVFAHSVDDALAMARLRPGNLYRYHPDDEEFERRVRLHEAKQPERVAFARLNRSDNLNDPRYLELPVWGGVR